MEPLKHLEATVTPLPRGGYLVNSPEGYIQFGSPPETIKDTMALPNSVPRIFVLPRAMFDWRKGINLADLEFPIYYNFFLQQKKTCVICTRDQAGRFMKALQEALFGSKELYIEGDVVSGENGGYVPDLRSEINYFRGSIRFRDVLSLSMFNEDSISLGKVKISIDQNGDFEVFFGSKKTAHIPGVIPCKPMYQIGQRLPEPYKPPLFGVTCLGPSHGFDPTANTSGYIIWLNHAGIMIDPPINSTEWLESSNVNPKLIDSIILTHCHADHDAGTLQKILEEGKITVYSTKTVMRSFLKKYSSLTGEPVSYLVRLFDFRPVYIGKPVFMHGGQFNFFYMLHSIPTIGFTLKFQDQTFVYSSDHQGDPVLQKKLLDEGVIDGERYQQLQNFPWDSNVVYHESGIAPLHTPIDYLNSLPKKIQKKTVVYHIAKKDFPKNTNLTLATFGIENTLYFKTSRVSKGEHVIRKGEVGKYFYIIRTGNVSIQDEGLIGRKLLGTYEYFGEVALLSEVPRTADVVAETDVLLYAIEKDKFLSFIYGTEFEKTLRRLIANRSIETWNIMEGSPYLQRLTTYQKTWLESILVPKEFEKPGLLVKEGKSLEQFFIIREGEVEVSKGSRVVAALGRGDCIGAIQRIHGDEMAEFTVRHKGSLSVFAVERNDLLDYLEGNPGIGMKLAYDYYLRG